MKNNTELIALDMDGTITQHKSPLEPSCREILEKLSERYKIVMLCAGGCERVYNQLGGFPLSICGFYGMQYSEIKDGNLEIIFSHKVTTDREQILEYSKTIRNEFSFSEYSGDPVEFHESGLITFPILGTDAALPEKLAYDPDRKKRRKIYRRICEIFSGYNVFIGGTSSFDIAPKPYCKSYALEKYINDNGIDRKKVVFFGDDYGEGGNDSDIYNSDISFVKIDNYRDFPGIAEQLLL